MSTATPPESQKMEIEPAWNFGNAFEKYKRGEKMEFGVFQDFPDYVTYLFEPIFHTHMEIEQILRLESTGWEPIKRRPELKNIKAPYRLALEYVGSGIAQLPDALEWKDAPKSPFDADKLLEAVRKALQSVMERQEGDSA